MLRRAVLVPLTVAVLATAVAGCNATKRELTVVFTPTATFDQKAHALQACTGAAPHTSPEPSPTPGGRFNSPGVRFRIDAANDHDIAQLESCLGRQAGVRGFQDSSDSS